MLYIWWWFVGQCLSVAVFMLKVLVTILGQNGRSKLTPSLALSAPTSLRHICCFQQLTNYNNMIIFPRVIIFPHFIDGNRVSSSCWAPAMKLIGVWDGGEGVEPSIGEENVQLGVIYHYMSLVS